MHFDNFFGGAHTFNSIGGDGSLPLIMSVKALNLPCNTYHPFYIYSILANLHTDRHPITVPHWIVILVLANCFK